jgi:hypothetical protein
MIRFIDTFFYNLSYSQSIIANLHNSQITRTRCFLARSYRRNYRFKSLIWLQKDSRYIDAARATQETLVLLRGADSTENTFPSSIVAAHSYFTDRFENTVPKITRDVYLSVT